MYIWRKFVGEFGVSLVMHVQVGYKYVQVGYKYIQVGYKYVQVWLCMCTFVRVFGASPSLI